jgi:hypothetical protein
MLYNYISDITFIELIENCFLNRLISIILTRNAKKVIKIQ